MNAPATTRIQTLSSSFVPYAVGDVSFTLNWDQLWALFPSLTTLTLSGCELQGSLPSKLPSTLTTFSIFNNLLTGSIPASLFDNYASITSTTPKSFAWSFSRNHLTGTLPPNLLTSLPGYSNFFLNLDYNSFTGPIPSTFLALTHGSTTLAIQLTLNGNTFAGALPADLWGLPSNMPLISSLNINVNDAAIAGTIPVAWISGYSFPKLGVLTLTLKDCQITGGLHSGVLPASAPVLTSYLLELNSNSITLPIPSSLLSAILAYPFTDPSFSSLSFYLNNNLLAGTLTLPAAPSTSTTMPRITISAASNALTALNVGVNASKYLQHLDVSFNSGLQGTVENLFSSSSSVMDTLYLQNTLMSGTMPFMGSMALGALKTIQMDNTEIDFCSGGSNRTAWTASLTLTACSLKGTTAYGCSSIYPSLCQISAPAPKSAPIEIPTVVPCSTATKPSDQFECINGIWVTSAVITTPTLVIPSGASETIVESDIESSSIVFAGLGTTLTINGCALNLTSITLTLTPDDLKGSDKIVQQLLVFGASNCTNDNLSEVTVNSKLAGSTCRKVKASKSVSNGQLSGIFTIDSSPCNRWWIILVSVICAVVIVGVVIFALLIIFVPAVRLAVRPFSGAKRSDAL